jgi:glutamyl-tRNA synthetase
LKTGSTFFVPQEDMQKMNVGDMFRLKDLCNVTITKIDGAIAGEYAGKELLENTAKIQWTPEKYVDVTVVVPGLLFEHDTYNPDSLHEVHGFAEEAVSKVKNGDIVQFERFGFVRLEKKDGGVIGFFAHK